MVVLVVLWEMGGREGGRNSVEESIGGGEVSDIGKTLLFTTSIFPQT